MAHAAWTVCGRCMYPKAMKGVSDRGGSSGLHGRLSEVYFPALVAAQTAALAQRLGDRATIDDPLFGRASGMAEIAPRLAEIASWLAVHDAAFDNFGFVTGSDRDVTEGALALTVNGALPNGWFASAAKVMVWLPCVTWKLWLTGAAAA